LPVGTASTSIGRIALSDVKVSTKDSPMVAKGQSNWNQFVITGKYFWQVNFGDSGSLIDINTLDKSSIVGVMIEGKLSLRIDPCEINGRVRDWMYFLVDGIYPDWSIFVKTYSCPTELKKKKFAAMQEKI
jgi:hypothetical protein